jgi:AAA domain
MNPVRLGVEVLAGGPAAHIEGMLRHADLDPELIAPGAAVDGDAAVVVDPEERLPRIVVGSVTARALYQVWSGRPVTVVDSPPGAGKSTLVRDVVAHLVTRSDIRVAVATFTREQARDIAGRIAAVTAPNTVCLALRGLEQRDAPPGVVVGSAPPRNAGAATAGLVNHVVVRTVAAAAGASAGRDAPTIGLLIVDEAYQVTFADVLSASAKAEQILLVGDPGQIGPVTTSNPAMWHGRPDAPHLRAPEVFARRDDAMVLHLDASYRLGPDTVAAIAPLYDFPFASARPHTTLAGLREIESLQVPVTGEPNDPGMLATVADRVHTLIGTPLTTPDGHRVLEPADVAVVVSHNAQASVVHALLRGRDVHGVTVGTADSLQGGQWAAVVALDPLTGAEGLPAHAMSPGRLCVMASRHYAHLTWVHDGAWRDAPAPDTAAVVAIGRARRVRDVLTS